MNEQIVRVHFIDGEIRLVEGKNIKHVGEEGARSGIATYKSKEYPIYNHPDWPDPWLWEEQIQERSGVCVECGRNATRLTVNGSCEGCVMQAMIDTQQ